ncbi:hypothetical protein RHGRI_017476 [Rhododendron griersonianum]|uniref:Uncharacterized protein n=1 Tax=Rhododendron griersonianum TaxID=479676 RepID=A0AAV6JXW9_9ERIC|nr:hypothetical protein RHGRI_017476 [Rhododendron griersonianum]
MNVATPNETYDGVEEGYESSRDEISSVSSYNPTKENLHTAFGSSLSLQSSVGRLDDQVLLRFSPKSSDSSYYFSDMIGSTHTFFNEEGSRRCLELSITLEMSETINRCFVHPSRRHSPTITKVQSDHHEVVADLLQTSFLFSIPMDGPMSFSTPRISVQWALRFEFFTTPKNVDWTRYDTLMRPHKERTCGKVSQVCV